MYSEGIFQDALNMYFYFFETYIFIEYDFITTLSIYFDEFGLGFLRHISIDEDFMFKVNMSIYTMSTFCYHAELFS